MIFFDIDGTLLDSAERHAELLLRLLRRESVPVPRDCGAEYLRYKADGNNTRSFLKNRLRLDEKTAERLSVEWRTRIEDEELLDMDRLYDDALPTLEAFASMGVEVRFLSSRTKPDSLRAELLRLGIARYAAEIHVVNPLDGAHAKIPVIERVLKIRPGARAWIVGDTEADYYPAKELALPCYLLHRGFRSRTYWEKIGQPTHSDLRDLPPMFRKEGNK